MVRAEYGAGWIRQRGVGRWQRRVFARPRCGDRAAASVTEAGSGAGGHKGSDATAGEPVEQGLELTRETCR
ncbi:MAG: hypothetical protein M3450_02315 [Actinomycetota bacterium]|nr:hypothetical protein [Actinomycetota bacterium]